MRPKNRKIKLGILGCGAIGTGVAKRVKKDLKDSCTIACLYDIDKLKTKALAKKLSLKNSSVKNSISGLTKNCDLILEAIASPETKDILKSIIKKKTDVLVMSVGSMLNAKSLFNLANKNKCRIIIPSGAIAGIDAIKASSLEKFDKISLTTRKPIRGLAGNPALNKIGINLSKIKKETIIFRGDVDKAIKIFPKNINVAATLALACGNKKKLTIKIITSPKFKRNSHEVEIIGNAGRIVTVAENVPCPDNPKTSYLAVLSGFQAIKEYCVSN